MTAIGLLCVVSIESVMLQREDAVKLLIKAKKLKSCTAAVKVCLTTLPQPISVVHTNSLLQFLAALVNTSCF